MTPHATIHRPLFVERLSKVLSEADFPKLPGDRAADFARIFDLDVPILGICYGHQVMADMLGGKVEKGTHREFGKEILMH